MKLWLEISASTEAVTQTSFHTVTGWLLQDFDDPMSEHLYDHDYLFWSGDLNYRIELGNEEVSFILPSMIYQALF